jgi:hypothetical protein
MKLNRLLLLLLLPCLTLILSGAARFRSVNSNVTLVDPSLLGPYIGADDLLQCNFALPWLRDEKEDKTNERNGVPRAVPYCDVNDAARDALHCNIMKALATWARALGFNRQANGHSLG